MTTLTIKVNERTKAGKTFIAMTETFLKNAKGIEIVEKSPYNSKFVKKVLDAEKRGKYTTIKDVKNVWESIL